MEHRDEVTENCGAATPGEIAWGDLGKRFTMLPVWAQEWTVSFDSDTHWVLSAHPRGWYSYTFRPWNNRFVYIELLDSAGVVLDRLVYDQRTTNYPSNRLQVAEAMAAHWEQFDKDGTLAWGGAERSRFEEMGENYE